MSQRRQWDRDAQPGPAWARNLVRRAYLVVEQDTGAEQVFETTHPCAVGDVIAIPAIGGMLKIVAREAAAAPYIARLIVIPAVIET